MMDGIFLLLLSTRRSKRNCKIPPETNLTCKLCSKAYSSREKFRRHLNSHKEKKFSCDLCPYKFLYKSTLDKHKRVVHIKEDVYTCDFCDKKFTNPMCAKIHVGNIHLKDYKFFCDKCGKGYYQRTQLITHVESVHQGVRHTCDICSKIFTTKANLKKHSLFHAPNYKRVECPICFKVFAPRSYKLHEKKHLSNTEVNLHICEICGKSVSSSWSLKEHMRTHTGEKPYACDFCGKCFSKSQILTTHKRTHTKERPFVCKICNKAFTQKPALNVHNMRFHSKIKPYSCGVCCKVFVTKSLLNKHNCPGS